ncbi:glycosyltransferase [Niallia taxi]|uniref:glycosyltransferase n=1 Tax=Niallia taxi TaxID=2499688 RepID=UPI003D2CE00F
MKIVFLSHTHRGSIFKVGSSHLARELEKMGHEILFISTPISFLTIGKSLISSNKNRLFELKQKLRLIRGRRENKEINIVDYIPFTFFPYTKLPLSDSLFTAKHAAGITYPSIKHTLKKNDFLEVDLVLMDDPTLVFMKKYIKTNVWVYRMTDIYSEMPNTQKSISDVEGYISRFTDEFIATSKPVADKFEEKWGKTATVFENGVDYNHFQGDYNLPTEFDPTDTFRAIYIGSLDKRFNWDILIDSAKKLPAVKFYIIGPNDSVEEDNLPLNIRLLGSKPYETIPAYLAFSNVGLLPLINGNSNTGRSPMKLYEYGAAGLPVVATKTVELERRNLQFVYLADDVDEFTNHIQDAINQKELISNNAKEISLQMSWGNITKNMVSWLKDKKDYSRNF